MGEDGLRRVCTGEASGCSLPSTLLGLLPLKAKFFLLSSDLLSEATAESETPPNQAEAMIKEVYPAFMCDLLRLGSEAAVD